MIIEEMVILVDTSKSFEICASHALLHDYGAMIHHMLYPRLRLLCPAFLNRVGKCASNSTHLNTTPHLYPLIFSSLLAPIYDISCSLQLFRYLVSNPKVVE